MAASFSATSCGKLMHVFSTDIGFLFFFLDFSPSTIINQNKIKPLDLKGGSGVQGGLGVTPGGPIILKLRGSAARLLLGNVKSLLAASGYIARARAYVRVHARACACVKLDGKQLRVGESEIWLQTNG